MEMMLGKKQIQAIFLLEFKMGRKAVETPYINKAVEKTCNVDNALGLPGNSVVKNLPVNTGGAGDSSLIPGSGRSPGEGNGNPLHDFCLENPMDRGAWWATVCGVTKSQTRLSSSSILSNNQSMVLDPWNICVKKEYPSKPNNF